VDGYNPKNPESGKELWMRDSFGRSALAALLFVSMACATAGNGEKPAATSATDGAELTAVIDAIKRAIVEAETRDVAGFPALKKIVVRLQTTVARSASGEIRYLVATLHAGATSEAVSILELDLKPVEPPRQKNAFPERSLQDALGQAIHMAKTGVAAAAKGDPPLTMMKITVELKFAVSVDGSIGAGASVKVLPVGLNGTASISRERVHTVTLTFGAGG
jgi:hypothetical protein